MVQSVVLVSEHNLRLKILILLLGLFGVLAACGGAPVAPTPADTEIPPTPTLDFVVVTGSGERSTLPPTWTPLPTGTPAPPTLTPTPTETFTPAPTFTRAEVCENFTVAATPREERPYLTGDAVTFLYLAEFPDAVVRITLVNLDTGSEQGGEYPTAVTPGGSYQIDEPGTYEWTIGVIVEPYNELCQQSGRFEVVAPPDSVEFTPVVEPTEETESTGQAAGNCEGFTVEPAFTEGQEFAADDTISITLNSDADDLFMRVVFEHQLTRETHTIEVPTGQPFTLDLPVALLFGPGIYEWTASLYSDETGEQCATSGRFAVANDAGIPSTVVITPSDGQATATATATPTAQDCVPLTARAGTATALAVTVSPTPTARASATPCPTFTPTVRVTRQASATPTTKTPTATP